MSAIQLLAAVFAVAMMYQTFLNSKRHDIQARELVFWEAVWLGLLLVSLFPGPLQNLVGVAHVARLLDLVMIVGMLLFGVVIYQLYVSSRRLTKTIEELVRSDALGQLASQVNEDGPPE